MIRATRVGFRHGVYRRIVRLALHEKGVPYRVEVVDRFDAVAGRALRGLPPFGRIPVLRHGWFDLCETATITRFFDAAFDGPALGPTDS